MSSGASIIDWVAQRQDLEQFRRKHWEGSFEEYLDLVRQDPRLTRNAFQRVYDMIMSYGCETYEPSRGETRTRYLFFSDPDHQGQDAVFGLDETLEHLVNSLKSAAKGYGIEKRVLLLHGPVGSSKSTIARLLKKGLERYSAQDEGALYSLGWVDEDSGGVHWCPMNEEPLHLIPRRFRKEICADLNAGRGEDDYRLKITGELDPFCRFYVRRAFEKVRWRLDQSDPRRAGAPRDPFGTRPSGNRHVSTQGRKEPGFDRTDRRHQLSQNRGTTAAIAIRGRSTSMANSTWPTAALSNSLKC